MTHYIQKLHDENLEIDLLEYMQEVFHEFEISYNYATKHAGYFTFKQKGKIVTEFIITNFFCHSFNMDDNLQKCRFEKEVNSVYRRFMASLFDDYIENFENTEITKQNEHLLA